MKVTFSQMLIQRYAEISSRNCLIITHVAIENTERITQMQTEN